MDTFSQYDVCSGLDQFIVIGVNYHKTDAATRGSFAITEDSIAEAFGLAHKAGLTDIIILSTCNRTEVYGIASAETLINILCSVTQNPVNSFMQHAYVRRGMEAVQHLFRVSAGLDSQIIGDYEILMQLKLAAKKSKENNLLGSLLDRLVNFALQASKRIKTETKLSTGTVSVGYAAIEVIREKVSDLRNKNILLLGAGKFGQSVAKNINQYFPGTNICIVNRTHEKAQEFAVSNEMDWAPYESLRTIADEADILIVSTSANEHTIIPEYFTSQKPRLILDLSVPANVDPAVRELEGIILMNVDQISAILDTTLAMRQAEVPRANQIMEEIIGEFVEWHKIFLHRHFLGEVKSKLYELSLEESNFQHEQAALRAEVRDARIQKAVNTLAVDLRSKTAKGCQYINTLSHYLQIK